MTCAIGTPKQLRLDVEHEIIVDLFAGGGGMSLGIEQALGRSPDIAINHNDDALSMHRRNHPQTRHFIADVWEVCPRSATRGRPVGLLHLSPDCTHHSQAAGGQPRDKKIRALSWVGYRWAGQVAPRVLTLENVKQILQWGPLVAKRDNATGRVVTLDKVKCPTTGKLVNRVASPGERVPVERQYLVPDKRRAGRTWRKFVRSLEALGYEVEWKSLVAADYGAPTTRERLFMVARRDGNPIVWSEPTHDKYPGRGQKRWRSAAECIDWSIPAPSIFDRKRPLAENTLKRIAKGVHRYVLTAADPFIVPIAHYNGSEPVHDMSEPMRTVTARPLGGTFAVCAPTVVPATHQGDHRVHGAHEPMRTVTGANRGELMLTAATMVQTGYGERKGLAPRTLDLNAPLGTVVAGGTKHAVAAAYLAQMNGGFNETPGHDPRRPVTSVTSTGSQQQLVTAHLAHLRANCDARDPQEPLRTISAGGEHHAVVAAHLTTLRNGCIGRGLDEPAPTVTAGDHAGVVSAFLSSYYTDDANRARGMGEPCATVTTENRFGLVECTLAPEFKAGALRVAAFLMRYYSQGGQWGDLREPMDTVTTRDRLALVTVTIQGTPYVIVDIGLRMLVPRELYRAQGFGDEYDIDVGHDGRRFTKSAQVSMAGNSVSPPKARAIIAANCADLAVRQPQYKVTA